MAKISVMVIAKNEEARIEAALQSVKWADEIIVVDSFSTDRTVEITKRFTGKIFQRKFDDFSSQKNFGISKCLNEWIFSLDCDEQIEESLRAAMRSATENSEHEGFRMLRKNFIFGKILNYGGNGNDWVLRLFKKRGANFANKVHETVIIPGSVGRLCGGVILHHSTPSIYSYIDKLNRYTDIESSTVKNQKFLILKLLVYPGAEFVKRYILQMGFLDSMEGFIYALLSSVYRFVIYAKRIL